MENFVDYQKGNKRSRKCNCRKVYEEICILNELRKKFNLSFRIYSLQ